jgi:putative DNA methylase
VALTTFSDLVGEAMARVERDAIAAGLPDDGQPLRDGGTGATAYADAVGVYLGVALSRLTDICNALCCWEVTKTQVRHLFGRQAIPMIWDYAENNVFGEAAGDYMVSLGNMVKALQQVPALHPGFAKQDDAQSQSVSADKLVSTDPPYYDNIGYADLSDFFYIWLRRSLRPVFPDLFATLAVPKAEELVAFAYRHSGKAGAEAFFLGGMTQAMQRLAEQAHPAFPVAIYYAFKQQESAVRTEDLGPDADDDLSPKSYPLTATSSTGWETFLDAVIRAGFGLSGTWPTRTELGNRMRGMASNALASSIVLVCRPRPADAPTATRREFVAALKAELPVALAHLQRGNIAPVDLAQAAIGPGMAIYTRYAKVLEADGTAMSVRTALVLINQALDEYLAEQEGAMDSDSRFCLSWFEQYGMKDGPFGEADVLARAKNTSVDGIVRSGCLSSRAGKVRLLTREEMPAGYDPATDDRRTVWECAQHLIKALDAKGETGAASLMARLGPDYSDQAKALAYRLFAICERKGWAEEALAYNRLITSWGDVQTAAASAARVQYRQTGFDEI